MRTIAKPMVPCVAPFVGSNGGGQYAFHLLRSTPGCSSRGAASASRRGATGGKHRARAAAKFLSEGWSPGGAPACPGCRRPGTCASGPTSP